MPTKITVSANGPLRLEGDFEVYDPEGGKFEFPGRATVSLCRCGQSNNKPLCDGSHRNGFQSVVKARVVPPPPPPTA
jgi:CDGSH-type Zn-finger protein